MAGSRPRLLVASVVFLGGCGMASEEATVEQIRAQARELSAAEESAVADAEVAISGYCVRVLGAIAGKQPAPRISRSVRRRVESPRLLESPI